MRYSELVGEDALRRALTPYPAWLADTYRMWIRAEEAKGNTFTCADAAVHHATRAV